MKTQLGAAWLILEESFHGQEKRLLSIISARKGNACVRDLIEQRYVDAFASFEEKIGYKKNRDASPFRVERYEETPTIITCGHEPVYWAYRCHKLQRKGSVLVFWYRIFKGRPGSIEVHEHTGEVGIA